MSGGISENSMEKGLVARNGLDIGVSDVLKSFTVIIVAVLMVDVVTRIIPRSSVAQYEPLARYVQTQAYFGILDPRVLHATGEVNWVDLVHATPYVPWITCDFYNDGPDSVFIAVNHPSVYSELQDGESLKVDLTGAERRIEVVFYKCRAGETATVRVVGKY